LSSVPLQRPSRPVVAAFLAGSLAAAALVLALRDTGSSGAAGPSATPGAAPAHRLVITDARGRRRPATSPARPGGPTPAPARPAGEGHIGHAPAGTPTTTTEQPPTATTPPPTEGDTTPTTTVPGITTPEPGTSTGPSGGSTGTPTTPAGSGAG
jgi:hypothetical protein